MIRIDISTDSAAFHDRHDQDVHHPGPELARILHDLANEIADGAPSFTMTLRDTNGNRVGTCSQVQDDEDFPVGPGDFYYDAATGFTIVTDHGNWEIPTEQGRRMAAAMLDMSFDTREGDVADLHGTDSGIEITVPGGRPWKLSHQQARYLSNGIASLLDRK